MGWWVGACGMMVVCGHRDTGKNCTRPESRCRWREGCSQFVCAVCDAVFGFGVAIVHRLQ